MKSNRVCHLKLTLAMSDGSVISDEEGMRLAGAKSGITRELLVNGDTTLYELHMAIQRAFGWKNMHLHRFSLGERMFGCITGGSADIYMRLCGSLFRPYAADRCESGAASKLIYEDFGQMPQKMNALFERLTAGELFTAESSEYGSSAYGNPAKPGKKYIEAWRDRVLENSEKHGTAMTKVYDDAGFFINGFNTKLTPFLDSVNYRYDDGDGWYVNILCTEIYDCSYAHTVCESRENAGLYADSSEKITGIGFDSGEWCDTNGKHVPENMIKAVKAANIHGICGIASDGMNLFDDIGGVDGFFAFLKAVYGNDKNEADRMAGIAAAYGWSAD